MNYITIENLEVFANHGVLKEENNLGQKFMVCARLFYDFKKASENDEIEYAVNYAEVCAFIVDYMKNNTFRLIETVADRLADEILINYSSITKAEVTVKKPWAPIGLPIENVSAAVEREWTEIYLSIGSNMGDRKKNLEYVVSSLMNNNRFKNVKASSFIETKPYGEVEQEDFLNAAVKACTLMAPGELLAFAHKLEQDMNRVREIHWGPRTLDVDILFYGNETYQDEELVIPHPDMCNRDFVLIPMCEIAPYFVHPQKGMNMVEMKNALNP